MVSTITWSLLKGLNGFNRKLSLTFLHFVIRRYWNSDVNLHHSLQMKSIFLSFL